jgi:hypothetical protein
MCSAMHSLQLSTCYNVTTRNTRITHCSITGNSNDPVLLFPVYIQLYRLRVCYKSPTGECPTYSAYPARYVYTCGTHTTYLS